MPSARCSRASRRWRACASSRRHAAPGAGRGYLGRWGDFIIGLSYLWEGQVLLAEQLLRPTLAEAEADLGRRNPFACMLAALLAAALWERDQPAEATALLANRLDVLERSGLPECVLLGYRTLARIAIAAGRRAPRHSNCWVRWTRSGGARKLPRLRLASLADQVRMHARRFRPETCRELCRQIDALLADPTLPQGPLWQRSARLLQQLAHGYAAIAAQDWRRALAPLAARRCAGPAGEAGPAAHRDPGPARLRAGPLRREVAGPAARGARPGATAGPAPGVRRRPSGAGRLGAAGRGQRSTRRAALAGPLAAPMRPREAAADAARLRATPSMALTPKEREVLELLARNLSNKEIGLAMQVGEETIKWHMKNLFAKLDAGTRKQVVSRARILGLLADAG